MAYTTIDDSSLFRSTTLYTGDASAGRSLITGTFAPDTLWFKSRSATGNHHIYGTNQGTQKFVSPNSDNGQGSNGGTDGITAFNSTGVTMGGNSATNESGTTFVVWSWLADGVGSANGDGSTTTTATSANTTSGFSVVTYTGTGSAATIGHGLGAVPKVIIVKKLNASDGWFSYHEPLGNLGRLMLNNTNTVADASSYWNSTTPTSSVFSVLNNGANNATGETYIAYCFADVAGYSKFGGYTGNGNADGPFIYTGFKPAWVMVKNTGATENWIIFDNKRPGYNLTDALLKPNLSNAESTSGVKFDLLSNGFKARVSDAEGNSSSGSFIYMAFGESPFVNSSGVPNNAR